MIHTQATEHLILLCGRAFAIFPVLLYIYHATIEFILPQLPGTCEVVCVGKRGSSIRVINTLLKLPISIGRYNTGIDL